MKLISNSNSLTTSLTSSRTSFLAPRLKTAFAFVLLLTFSGMLSAQSLELLYNWRNGDLVGSAAFANVYNEIWGYEQNGSEYAIIGTTYGTHFFDVTDPANVVTLDSVEGGLVGPQVIHRDYHDFNGYLYAVCDEGFSESTLQIIDMSLLPETVSVVYDSDSVLQRAHNIFIDESQARLYAFSVSFGPGYAAIASYSIVDPLNPQLLGTYSTGLSAHDGYVKDNIMFLNDGSNGRIVIMDWTDPTDVQILGSLDSYPDMGYNHSGWLSEDGNTYVFADETHGMKMKVCDVSDYTDIQVLSTILSEEDSMSIAHNQIIKGDLLYTAHYHDGLYIHDISDPSNPFLVANYSTYLPNDHVSYRGAWGVYPLLPSGLILVSDMQYGLFVFRLNEATGIETPAIFKESLQLSPNPFSGELLNVSFELGAEDLNDGKLEAALFDLGGNLIRTQSMNLNPGANQFELAVGPLADGLYVLKLSNGAMTFSEQFIKMGGH